MAGDLRELELQFGSDPAGDQHHHQTIASNPVDRVHRLRRHLAPRRERAIEVTATTWKNATTLPLIDLLPAMPRRLDIAGSPLIAG